MRIVGFEGNMLSGECKFFASDNTETSIVNKSSTFAFFYKPDPREGATLMQASVVSIYNKQITCSLNIAGLELETTVNEKDIVAVKSFLGKYKINRFPGQWNFTENISVDKVEELILSHQVNKL